MGIFGKLFGGREPTSGTKKPKIKYIHFAEGNRKATLVYDSASSSDEGFKVTPRELYKSDGKLYLVALYKGEERTYRVDRINSLRDSKEHIGNAAIVAAIKRFD